MFYGLPDAVLDVVLEEDGAHLLQRRDDTGYLGEDVYAVGLLVHHPLQTPHLALDPPEPVLEQLFVLGLYVAVGDPSTGVARLILCVASITSSFLYTFTRRSRRALLTTVTEESAIATAARTGLRNPYSPSTGLKTHPARSRRRRGGRESPAATGMSATL